MSVMMIITNRAEYCAADAAGWDLRGQAWSPYVLRGVEPGRTSWDYVPGETAGWTSETFKITGILPNGHTSMTNSLNWIDLRWFVFKPDSFYQNEWTDASGVVHPKFSSDIEILDPLNSTDSPGYGAGWYEWEHDDSTPHVDPFFRWDLNTRLRPFEVEVLKQENYYE